jgi:YidC/Oxa1 family membrane protein insertase
MNRAFLTFFLALSCIQPLQAGTRIVTETLELNFSGDGSLEAATACFPRRTASDARCSRFADQELIRHRDVAGAWNEIPNHSDTHFELQFQGSSGAALTWKIPRSGYRIELDVQGLTSLNLTSGTPFRPPDAAGFGGWLEQTRYLGVSSGDVEQVGLDETEQTSLTAENWIGFRNRFWALLVSKPEAFEAGIRTQDENPDASIELALDEDPGTRLSIYLGPVEPAALSAADAVLSDVLYAGIWFWLRWICFALFYILGWILLVVPSAGLAVMLMSLVVHVLMLPLSRIAERFQRQVQATEARLAPELQRIKKEFKGEKQSAKILALYKTEKVHPLYSLKSMLGVAVVIPVFIGAFDMLAENIHLMSIPFLWISDLSQPDAVFVFPFTLPFFGSDLNLLPLLMTGLSVIASALHNPPALTAEMRRKQVINMVLLAVGFFALFYTFPAGMVLYWTTNNLISVTKSLWAQWRKPPAALSGDET